MLYIFIENWSEITSGGHDFKLITPKYSNEMIQSSHQQSSRASINEFNNLRGSMSSSTSSIQNNMVKKKNI
jgi:hypothetical protein